MSKFVIPNAVSDLPDEQQQAILHVLKTSGLLTESGESKKLTSDNTPEHYKAFLDASLNSIGKMEPTDALLGLNFGCVAARVAEAAAIVACATVPGGQIALAACVAAAHALADEACK